MRPVEVRVAVERAGSVAPAVVEDADVDVEVVSAVVVAPNTMVKQLRPPLLLLLKPNLSPM